MTKKARINELERHARNQDITNGQLYRNLAALEKQISILTDRSEAHGESLDTLEALIEGVEERRRLEKAHNTFLEWVKIKNAKSEGQSTSPAWKFCQNCAEPHANCQCEQTPQDPEPPRCPECGKGETEGLYFENEACFFTCVCGYKQRDWGSRRQAESELRKRLGGA